MPESVRIKEDELVMRIIDPVEALRMLAASELRPFTQDDWFGFAGCETKNPMIGELGGFTIVLDGAILNFIHHLDGYGGTLFELKGGL